MCAEGAYIIRHWLTNEGLHCVNRFPWSLVARPGCCLTMCLPLHRVNKGPLKGLAHCWLGVLCVVLCLFASPGEMVVDDVALDGSEQRRRLLIYDVMMLGGEGVSDLRFAVRKASLGLRVQGCESQLLV